MITTRYSFVALIVCTSLLVGCDSGPVTSPASDEVADQNTGETSNYIGSTACADCHQEAYKDWQQSHHDLAMQPMSPDTVLGDFNNSSFEHQGVKTEFFIEDGIYSVRTAGPDGSIEVFPLRHTFGTSPLQQYLVELPNGRVQALSTAWDSRPEAEGGQRWFHVYGDEPIDHTDVLHWTRQSQNWDTMCAACHSTGLVKKYDLASDKFDTTFQEVNVACESCHGPAKGHLAWLKKPDDQPTKGFVRSFNERDNVNWALDPATGNSTRSEPRVGSNEITACASCHSRRAKTVLGPATDAEFLNDHIPVLIEQELYFADGQPLDEVYVYGSFLQSKMHQQGVTCSDCHNPHSLELRAPGPQVCLQCHAAETFASEKHHLHKPGSDGADCVECHMPPTTYMQIDSRHDHSFRTPKPWLSEMYGTPNACQNCHTDKTAAWASDILKTAGIEPGKHWSETFAAALNADSTPDPTDIEQLTSAADTPDIIKATAFSNGLFTLRPDALNLLIDSLKSDNTMLRWGAARGLNYADPATQAQIAPPLLQDPVKAIRLEALPIVLSLGPDAISGSTQQQVNTVVDEYIATQMVNAERVESYVNLGNIYRDLQRFGKAEDAYLTALKINPDFVPAYINLSDLYRLQQRETEGQQLLLDGIARLPRQPTLRQMLGLSLVRQQRVEEALPYFRDAAELSDSEVRYAITYALALEATGQPLAAIAYLESVREKYNNANEISTAIATILQRSQQAAQQKSQQL